MKWRVSDMHIAFFAGASLFPFPVEMLSRFGISTGECILKTLCALDFYGSVRVLSGCCLKVVLAKYFSVQLQKITCS